MKLSHLETETKTPIDPKQIGFSRNPLSKEGSIDQFVHGHKLRLAIDTINTIHKMSAADFAQDILRYYATSQTLFHTPNVPVQQFNDSLQFLGYTWIRGVSLEKLVQRQTELISEIFRMKNDNQFLEAYDITRRSFFPSQLFESIVLHHEIFITDEALAYEPEASLSKDVRRYETLLLLLKNIREKSEPDPFLNIELIPVEKYLRAVIPILKSQAIHTEFKRNLAQIIAGQADDTTILPPDIQKFANNIQKP